MTTNQERAAEVVGEAYQQAMESSVPSAWRGTIAQALADAGLLAPDPQIIRTIEELDALDPDTVLIISATRRSVDWEITHDSDLPAVVIAAGEQVRAARKALEEDQA